VVGPGEACCMVELEEGRDSVSPSTLNPEPCTLHVNRFRGGLLFQAHRLVCPSTLGLIVIKKKKKNLTP